MSSPSAFLPRSSVLHAPFWFFRLTPRWGDVTEEALRGFFMTLLSFGLYRGVAQEQFRHLLISFFYVGPEPLRVRQNLGKTTILWGDYPLVCESVSLPRWRREFEDFLFVLLNLFSLGALSAFMRLRKWRRSFSAFSVGSLTGSSEPKLREILPVFLAGWAVGWGLVLLGFWAVWSAEGHLLWEWFQTGVFPDSYTGTLHISLSLPPEADVPSEMMSQLALVLNGLSRFFVWGFVVFIGWCWALTPYEFLWWRSVALGARLGGARVSYQGSFMKLLMVRTVVWGLDMALLALARPWLKVWVWSCLSSFFVLVPDQPLRDLFTAKKDA